MSNPFNLRPIEPPDSHYLSSATGWLELGNHLESNLELHKIDPLLRSHPDVMEVRWRIYARAKWWEAALDLSHAIVRLAPDRSSGYILRALGLRRVKGLMSAWMSILPLVDKFPEEPLICFYLACFGCQMGNMESARQWLAKAAKKGENDKERLIRLALGEPDLLPLLPEFKSLGLGHGGSGSTRAQFFK